MTIKDAISITHVNSRPKSIWGINVNGIWNLYLNDSLYADNYFQYKLWVLSIHNTEYKINIYYEAIFNSRGEIEFNRIRTEILR